MAEANNAPPSNPSTRFDWRGELTKFRRPGPVQIGILAGVVALLALLVAATPEAADAAAAALWADRHALTPA